MTRHPFSNKDVNACSVFSTRATLIGIGGKTPRGRFDSDSEPFTLRLDGDQARKLGRYLYQQVDIIAKVFRGSDGTIEDGWLDEFRPLDGAKSAAHAWREWFRVNASEWDQIEDIEGELGRKDPTK